MATNYRRLLLIEKMKLEGKSAAEIARGLATMESETGHRITPTPQGKVHRRTQAPLGHTWTRRGR